LTHSGNYPATDEQLHKMRNEAATMLDCPELKQVRVRRCHVACFYKCLSEFQYDLRVVFIHDGLYGRKHLYSYVHDKGQWWKIADSLIEQVSVSRKQSTAATDSHHQDNQQVTEDIVLNDTSGLHLGAGPYLLLYSRILDEENERLACLPWPGEIKVCPILAACSSGHFQCVPQQDDVKRCNMAFLSQLPSELVRDITQVSPQTGTSDADRRNDRMDVT